MEYIYSVVMQPGKTAIRNRIMKKYNEMTEEEKRLKYFETNHDNQIAVAYVFMANQVHRELLKKNNTVEKISLNSNIKISKDKFTINLYEYNIDEHVNNDEMGNDFNKDLKKEDFPKDANFLCKDSLDTLKLIRHDTSLFGQWMSYLNFVNNLRKQSMEYFDIKHQRSNTLFSLHKKLYGLRKLTREYFRKKAAQSIDPEEVDKYLYMVDVYREKDIKFYISNANNFYNSEEFKERYNRYIERREACESNRKIKEEEKKRKEELESKYIKNDNYKNYIKDIYDRKFSSRIDTKIEDNSIKLNRPYKTRRIISKNCNHDSMGVCIGCSVEENIDVVGLLGIDIFITDQSYFILKYLKENYVEVFNSWVLLFNRKASNIITDEEYNNELCELLTKTAIILKNKSNFSNFDRFMRSGALRIGRAAYQMKKTRKKEI